MIKKFNNFSLLNEEVSPRLPIEEDYWLRKGKKGKKVALYTHDDMDGIFSAIEVKKYLLNKGFTIEKYGILNYMDGWKYTSLDPKLINVVVDFANMPGDERDQMIDYYLDHHGIFTEEEKERYKNAPVSKSQTASAYEAICLNLGVPQDDLTVSVIRMIDAAKYGETTYKVKEGDTLDSISDEFNLDIEDLKKWNNLTDENIRTGQIINIINPESEIIVKERPEGQQKTRKNPDRKKIKVGGKERYDVSWKRLLDFNLSDMKNYKNVRLQFAAAFNQMLKRGDHQTLISVIHNCKDASIYSIFNTMKAVYGSHNVVPSGPRKGEEKDFISDSEWRLNQMQSKTRGNKGVNKKIYQTQQDFLKDFVKAGKIRLDGYTMIGDLAFVPTGTWANALRARSIIETDFQNGIVAVEPKFILLQYGGTLQVCSYKPMSQTQNLPVLKKNGKIVDDLGVYMTGLLKNFQEYLGYFKPKDIVNLVKNFIDEEGLLDQGTVQGNDDTTIYFSGQFTIKEDGVEKPDNKKFDLDKFNELLNVNGLSISNFEIGLDTYVDEISTYYKVNYIVIPKSSVGQDEITVSGGHGGIGSISNIFGTCRAHGFQGVRFIDMFKNKIITDLSGVPFAMETSWGEAGESREQSKPEDYKVIPTEQVTKLDQYGKVIKPTTEKKIMNFSKFNNSRP